MNRRYPPRALVAAIAASSLVACGGSPTASPLGSKATSTRQTAAEQVYARFNGMSGNGRMEELVRAAEQEGQLSLYTTLTSDSADAVKKAFESRYKITVSVYRASSETIIQRVQSEQEAGFAGGNDVLELNGLELTALNQRGYLADFKGAARDAVTEEGQRPGWTASRLNRFVVSRNSKLVTDASVPHDFEQFADPAWKERLSIEQGDVDWFMALHDYYASKGMSEAEFLGMFRRVAANSKVVSGHAPQMEQLAAGRFAVALATYDYQAKGSADKGAPVSYTPTVSPVVQRPNGVAMMKSAQHPAAAYLFYEWILTDGQGVLQDLGLTSSLASVAKKGVEEGVELVTVDVERLLAENKKYSDTYQQILTGS